MSFLKKNAKVAIPIASVVILFAIGGGVLSYQINSKYITKNVSIAGIDVSGNTEEEAIKKLNSNEKFKSVELKHKDFKWKVDVGELNLKIDFDKTVEDAYMLNRSGGVFSNMFITLKSIFGSKNTVPLVMTYDEKKLTTKLENIKSELDSPIKNADLEYDVKTEKVNIIPEEAGRTMNVKESKEKVDKELKKNNFNIDLDVLLKPAKLKQKDLEGIDTLLSSYSTRYGGMPGRDYNIKKSAEDSSGILMKKGDEFSFNGLTGEKTVANGYKYAPVIESGKLVLGCGGGVCQTSSTIFNAALLSGMDITTRRNHTIPSDYVSLGRDATVFDGNPGQDFKFKNPFDHSVYVKNFVYNGKVYSQIFGNNKNKQNIDISTQMLGSRGAGSKTIQDPTLPAGKKVIEKYSRPGYSVATYRTYKDADGNTIKTEKIGISSYPAQMGIVRVGAGAKAKATKITTPNTTQNQPSSNQAGKIQ